MEDKASDMRRTSIDASVASYSDPIVITVDNDGQTNLSDFAKWDIIAEYEQSGVTNMNYLTYAEAQCRVITSGLWQAFISPAAVMKFMTPAY